MAQKLKATNDTAVVADDLTKLSYNELKDTLTSAEVTIGEIDNKYADSLEWSADDAKAYKDTLEKVDAVQNALADHPQTLRDRRDAQRVPAQTANLGRQLATLGDRITIRPAAESDPTGRFGYQHDNQFMHDVCNAYTGQGVTDRLNTVLNAVGDDEYSAGGWEAAGIFIPEGFLNSIIRMTPEDDQLLGRMTSVPMAVPSLKIPAAVDKDHSTSFTGGTRVYRTSETKTTTLTKDAFEKVSMEANELIGESAVTKDLIRFSSISIPALIQSSQNAAMSYKRRDEIITGDGSGKYLGFLNPNNLALISVNRKNAQGTANILIGENILEMRKHVWDYDNAVWVFNYDLFEKVAQLYIESANNAGLIKLYSPQSGDVPESLLGRPIVWTEFMPGVQDGQDGNVHTEWGDTNLGSHFAACVNMTAYYHGQLYTDQAVSAHVRFHEREEVFQFVTSDDARPSWLTYLTPKRGITTRSPFVALNITEAS